MLYQKRNLLNAKKIYKAFSLIEILLSLTLGTIILFTFASLYSQIYRNNNEHLEQINIQMQSHQFLEYIKHHLQHSGYLGQNRVNTNYNKFLIENKSYYIQPNCLLFFYDVNKDGYIGSRKSKNAFQEVFGFKFENNEIHETTSSYSDYSTQKNTLCTSNYWKSITKNFQFIVNNLSFKKIEDNLIQIDISVSSRNYPKLTYRITAYTYLFNGID